MSTAFKNCLAVLVCLAGLSACDTQPHYYPAPPPVVIPAEQPAYYPPPNSAPAVVVAPAPTIVVAPPARPGVVFMPPPVVYAPATGMRVERSVAPIRVPAAPNTAVGIYPTTVRTGSAPPTVYGTKVQSTQPTTAPSGSTLSDRAGMMTGFRANTGPAPLPGVRQVPPSVIPSPPVRPVAAPAPAPIRAPMPATPASPVRPQSFTPPPPAAARPAPSTSWGKPATSGRIR